MGFAVESARPAGYSLTPTWKHTPDAAVLVTHKRMRLNPVDHVSVTRGIRALKGFPLKATPKTRTKCMPCIACL